jgi:hypothetical protein
MGCTRAWCHALLRAGARQSDAGIEGLAADRATGIGPGGAARQVEGCDTSRASSVSRWSVSPDSSGLMLAPLATMPLDKSCKRFRGPSIGRLCHGQWSFRGSAAQTTRFANRTHLAQAQRPFGPQRLGNKQCLNRSIISMIFFLSRHTSVFTEDHSI